MMIFYDLLLFTLALISSPKLLYDVFFKKKYRKSFLARCGRGFPRVEKKGRPLIWVHAVSMGEAKAVIPLVKELKKKPKNPLILFSTITETAQAEVKRLLPEADFHLYLPFDFSFLIRKAFRQAQPDLVIMSETDFWFNFTSEAKKQGASLILVNGKLSKTSFNRFSQVPFFAKKLFGLFDALLVQNEEYKERFLKLTKDPSKVMVTGNLKIEGFLPETGAMAFQERLKIDEEDLVFTCGSTHEKDEMVIFDCLKHLLNQVPSLKVLIVPRHPARFSKVAGALKELDLPLSTLSEGVKKESRVILVDEMGLLRKCYECSDLAFVGGSFDEAIGGHNILEPLFYEVPVLFGPDMHGQKDFARMVLKYQAGRSIQSATFLSTTEEFLKNKDLREQTGKNGKQLIEESQGALEMSLQTILKVFPCDK